MRFGEARDNVMAKLIWPSFSLALASAIERVTGPEPSWPTVSDGVLITLTPSRLHIPPCWPQATPLSATVTALSTSVGRISRRQWLLNVRRCPPYDSLVV